MMVLRQRVDERHLLRCRIRTSHHVTSRLRVNRLDLGIRRVVFPDLQHQCIVNKY